jgi:two-component system chemotaxis response regulator CheY
MRLLIQLTVSAILRQTHGRTAMAIDLSMPVLVVDDYSTMVRIIRNLLKQIGFVNIDDANDGGGALTKMRATKYGLVISDWNMEPMTGYDLLKQVRGDKSLAETPFIMITAESKTGVNNYIVKPFNAETLKSKIEAVFEDAPITARRDDPTKPAVAAPAPAA